LEPLAPSSDPATAAVVTDATSELHTLDPQEHQRLARFCSLASCLLAIVRGFCSCVQPADRAAIASMARRLLQLLLAVQRRASGGLPAAGDSSDGSRVELAYRAVQLALLAVAAAAEAGMEEESEGGGLSAAAKAALEAAAACLRMDSLPRWHAAQLLHAVSAVVRTSALPGPAAAALQQPLVDAWPSLVAALARLRVSPHADVVAAAAGALLAALRQGEGTPAGSVAAGQLVREFEQLQEQLESASAISDDQGDSSSSEDMAEEEDEQPATAAGGGSGSTHTPPTGSQPQRVTAFNLALLQAWVEAGAAPPPAALLGASTSTTLLRSAAGADTKAAAVAPHDADLALICVRLLAALLRRACVAAKAGAGDDDGALQLLQAAGDGLHLAFNTAAHPAPLRQGALQAAMAAARAAPDGPLRLAAAARVAAMAGQAAASPDAPLRMAAVSAAGTAAQALLQTTRAGGDASARSAVLGVASWLVALASDLEPAVAAAAQRAVGSLALPIYLLAAAADGSYGVEQESPPHEVPAITVACDPLAPAGREAIALQRQLRGFRPGQLAAVFEDVLQASPSLNLLTKQPAVGADGAWLAGPQLLQLARELPVLPAASTEAADGTAGGAAPKPDQQHQQPPPRGAGHHRAPALDPDRMTSCSEAAWYLAQEAARHCISARMKTHLGGPTQSFAALEKLLQGALARLQAAAGGGDGMAAAEAPQLRQRHGAGHLLDFVFALEAGIHSAAEGCQERAAPLQGVMAFFVANKRVCAEWYSRCRELLMQLANAAGCPHHALHHGAARLADVRAQLRALMAADVAYKQQQQAATTVAGAAAAEAAAVTPSGRGGGRGGRGRGGRAGGRLKGRGEAAAAAAAAGGGDADGAAASTAAAAAMSGLSLTTGSSRAPRESLSGASRPPAAPLLTPEAHRAQHDAALHRLTPAAADALAGCAAALVALADPDGVRGLRDWAADELAPLWKREAQRLEFADEADDNEDTGSGSVGGVVALTWLRGLEAQAAGRLEEAARLIGGFLSRSAAGSAVSDQVQGLLLEHLARCYAGLADWEALGGLERNLRRRVGNAEEDARQAAAVSSAAAAAAGDPQEPAGAAAASKAASQARSAAAAAAKAAGFLASLQRAEASALSSWTFAGGDEAGGGSGGGGGSTPLAAAVASSAATITACLSAMTQQRQGQQPGLLQACGQHAAALAEWCGASGWLGTQMLMPQLQQLSALQLLPLMIDSSQPAAAAAATAAALAAGALPGGHSAAGPSEWPAVLSDDGSLGGGSGGCLGLRDLTPLLQLLTAGAVQQRDAGGAVWAPVLSGLQLQTALAAARTGSTNLLERVLGSAAGWQSGGQQWVQLVGSRLRLQVEGDASALAEAVRQHLSVLGGLPEADDGSPADQQSRMLVLMSLSAVLKQALRSSDRTAAATAASAAAAAFGGGLQDTYTRACEQLSARGLIGFSGMETSLEFPEASLPLAACYAASIQCAPHQPGPWKALGDLAYSLACDQQEAASAAPDGGAADGTARKARRAWAIAAEAYCRQLAAAVAAKRLASPEAALGTLLRLLRLVLRRGTDLAAPLRASLGLCPAAAWQPLAPQLLAALSHAVPATRELAALLLRGVAAAAPCSVLYPCVAELRAAADRGAPVAPELDGVLGVLRRHDARLLPDTTALVEGLERLTVTPAERWSGLLAELEVRFGLAGFLWLWFWVHGHHWIDNRVPVFSPPYLLLTTHGSPPLAANSSTSRGSCWPSAPTRRASRPAAASRPPSAGRCWPAGGLHACI
jgi:hypothetical protein